MLQEPEYSDELPSYPYTDVLRLYDQATPIEEDLWLMWMEYRMRAFQSAFHANPDHAQWYGWGPLKETAVRIKAEDARLRLEAEAKENTASTPGFSLVLWLAAIATLVVILRRRG